MPDTPKRKPKTITAASKAKLPRPKRKRPKTTPSPLTGTPSDLGSQPASTFEAIEIGGPIVGNAASHVGTPCHDPAPIDEALWRASALPHTAPKPFDLPLAFLAIRRWLADRLTTLATFIAPTD